MSGIATGKVAALLLTLLTSPQQGGGGAVAPSIDSQASCGICHADVGAEREATTIELHESLECGDCHIGQHFNPHVASDLDEAVATLATSLRGFAGHSPTALAACAVCHSAEFEAWRSSIHGRAPRAAGGARTPTCENCHGSLHGATAAGQGKASMAARCIACHDFADEGMVPTDPAVVDTYRDTVHGKLLALGNTEAAACADCHTGHYVYASSDPRSTVHPQQRPATCRSCHGRAPDSFASAVSHRPQTLDADFWGWLVALGFSTLTLGVILLLIGHVALDLARAGRSWLNGAYPAPPSVGEAPVRADEQVDRFDVHMRLQHVMMIVSFVVLVVTGWPMKSASLGISGGFVDLLGGQPMLAFGHRLAAAVLIGVSLYHLGYLLVQLRRGQLTLSMLPSAKDFTDLWGNLRYFLGRSQRPSFGRWTYYEKFDYWAVFWGMVIMGGSGLVLWFPELSAYLMPGELVGLAYIAHSDEALLAALAIFIWHFYNTHLRPVVFPMSRVWLTGKISAGALYEEHRLEYERRFGSVPPGPARHAPTWHRHPRWSFVALALTLIGGLAVVVLDVSSVRQQLATMAQRGVEHALVGEPVSEVSGVPGVYDDGFDVFERCFECHARTRYDLAVGHFPHTPHFEAGFVDSSCDSCHEAAWHDRLVTSTEVCVMCHEPEEIGLQLVSGDTGNGGR